MARHNLQRLASPSRSFSLALHTLGLASFALAFHFLNALTHPISAGFGGNYQHLTNIGLLLSTATFVTAALADLTLNPTLFAAKNFLSVTTAPLEVLISLLYWGIRTIDKSLLYPPGFELALLPDVSFHLAPAVLLTLDLLLLSPPWTIRGYSALVLSLGIAFLYWGWVELCFSHNGWYPYPIFTVLDTTQRVGLFTFSAVLMTGSTVLLKWLYGKVNGVPQMQREAQKPLKKVQ
ncbi:integral membrane protein [Plectosphaerella plurivora]|uniref:Integral membrane protein n=1 Tax=Plectosphaerella plurivora TaxID=936078 RepID=A0A9P9AEA1_9PEZI|nr:integral membrane protein [Plectosphaerella plurivora]